MVDPEKHESFVARIWLEGSADQTQSWRGHLRHVQGEEECYFQSLSTMKEFLERISGVPVPENRHSMTEEKRMKNTGRERKATNQIPQSKGFRKNQ